MDFQRQPSRPAQRPASRTQANQPTIETPRQVTPPSRGSNVKRFVLVPLAIILLAGAGYGVGNYFPLTSGEYSRVDTEQYQAVFLTNDQVYFGKITAITGDMIAMKDIYYLQQGSTQEASADKQAQENPMSLAKFGSELHAPQDMMQINRDQVLYWENLRADGKVAEAIKAYKQ